MSELEEEVKIPSFRRGYTCFYHTPGTVDGERCAVCGAECMVERNRLGATTFVEHMAGHKSLHDYFYCKTVGQLWHDCLYRLVERGVMPHAQDVSTNVEPVVCAADPARAGFLAGEARAAERSGDIDRAIELLERASALDQTGALKEYWLNRVVLLGKKQRSKPLQATVLYCRAVHDQHAGNYDDAILRYCMAGVLDPAFLWPFNNAGWMFATAKDARARNGRAAIRFARHACEASRWRCWAFVGSLAAAYAQNGDFEIAVHFARAAFPFTPDFYRPHAERQRQCYERRQAFVDDGSTPVAAGAAPD